MNPHYDPYVCTQCGHYVNEDYISDGHIMTQQCQMCYAHASKQMVNDWVAERKKEEVPTPEEVDSAVQDLQKVLEELS